MKLSTALILFSGIIVGSINAQTASVSYEYDASNRLTRIDLGNSQVIEFTYDEVGNRTTHVISPYTVTQTVSVPSGNPPPIIIPNTQMTLDFESGPGGDVTIQETFGPPPLGTVLATVRNSKASALKKLQIEDSGVITNAAADTLIVATRYWEITSDMQPSTFTYILKIGYQPADFPEGLTENNVNILYFNPALSDYVELPTLRNPDQDSVQTVSPIDHFGRFALGVKEPMLVSVAYDFSVESGAWYLVSLPVVPQDNSLQILFPGAVAAFAWDYASQNYVAVTKLEPEKAYWLLMLSVSTASVSGFPLNVYTRNYTSQGWDLTGSVLQTSPLIDDPDGSVLAMFGWNPQTQSYFQVDPLAAEPMQGYWILVFNVPSTMTVGSNSGSAGIAKVSDGADLTAFYAKYGSLPPLPPHELAGNKLTPVPESFGLSQNYPNPFNPETVIEYQLPQASHVSLKIYDLMGREVRTLVNEEMPAGYHRAQWDGRDDNAQKLNSGVYLYRIQVAGSSAGLRRALSSRSGQGFVQTKKFI